MTVVAFIIGVLIIVIGVGISIGLHEIGHLVPAKKFGVKVTQYMVGFGPTIWSRKFGETEYGIKAIPLGGYIRMIGMFPPKPGADPSLLRASSTGRFSQLMDQARQQSMEEVGPQDRDRVFYKLTVPRKVVVMLGGPMMNFLIAAVLMTGLITIYGVQVAKDGVVVASVSQCVVPASASTQTVCKATDPETPAYRAGLLPKDILTQINGAVITPATGLSDLIRPRAGEPTTIVYVRDGSTRTTTVTPVRNLVAQVDANGQLLKDSTGNPVTVEAGFLGVTAQAPVVVERQPITAAPGYIGDALGKTAGVFLHIPQKMVGVWHAAFSGAQRDVNGPISVVGVGRIGGEVAAADLGPDSTSTKIAFLLNIILSLNLALFVFNLVPLLPLDGGHVAGALWEGVKRSFARVRGRADPGYVDVAKALPIAYTMAIVLIGMSALLIYADLANPVRLL